MTCDGDCNCDHQVTVDELLTMVNIALGNIGVIHCLPGDENDDGKITVDEILLAVNNAQRECARTPTATPGTPVPGSVGQRAAGSAVALADSLRAIPAFVSSLTQIAKGSGAAAADTFGADVTAAKPCDPSGSRELVCTQPIPGGPRDYTLTLDHCALRTTTGGTVTLNGTITAHSTDTFLASCSVPPLSLSTLSMVDLQVTVKDAGGATTMDALFNLTGSAAVTPEFSACVVKALDMVLTGTIRVQTASLIVKLEFEGTQVRLDNLVFGDTCVPDAYRMTLNGSVGFTETSSGIVFEGTFTDFRFTGDSRSGNDVVTMDGRIDSTCFGTEVTLSTETPLTIPPGVPCPSAGVLVVAADGTTQRVTYSPSGVVIDGTPYLSCLDTHLLTCAVP